MDLVNFLFCFLPSHNSIPPISHIFPTTNRCPTLPVCAAAGAVAMPHPRASAAAASRRRRTVPTRPTPSPVSVTASRGHPRWSLSLHQENRVGSIPSSMQHSDDLELLGGHVTCDHRRQKVCAVSERLPQFAMISGHLLSFRRGLSICVGSIVWRS